MGPASLYFGAPFAFNPQILKVNNFRLRYVYGGMLLFTEKVSIASFSLAEHFFLNILGSYVICVLIHLEVILVSRMYY